MTQAQLIAAMLQAAAPVVQAFHSDLAHDARLIADAKPGDVFMWAPYEHGSRVVVLWRERRPNLKAAEMLAAFNEASSKPLVWFIACVRAGECTLTACAPEAAISEAELTTRLARQSSNPVSEINM
jgi:hypothetical protein